MIEERKRARAEQLVLREAMAPTDWLDYCERQLKRIMEENRDVLVRLKNR